MPPKKAQSQIEIKSDRNSDMVEVFYREFDALTIITQDPQATEKAIKKAIKDLQPHLKKIISLLTVLDKMPATSFSHEHHLEKVKLQEHVGFVYMYSSNFTLARQYLKKAIASGLMLEPHFLLITLEFVANCPKDARAAREQLLITASLPKYAEEAARTIEKLSSHALELLKSYCQPGQPGINFKKFFSKYSKFLGTNGYLVMIAYYSEEHQNNPELQEKWRERLFNYIDSQGITELRDLRSLYTMHVINYLDNKKYVQCYHFINNNLGRLQPGELSYYAYSLFLQTDNHPEISDEILKAWFNQAAATGDTQAVTAYLEMFHNHRHYFNPKDALTVLDNACQLADVKGYAHYVYAHLHNDGYAHLNCPIDSFKHLQLSKDYHYPPALVSLAHKHSQGSGTPLNYPEAFRLLEEAHEMGSPDAGIFWAELVIYTATFYPHAELKQKLIKALFYLDACEQRSNAELARIAWKRAICLMYLEAKAESIKTILAFSNKAGGLKFNYIPHVSPKNPEVMKNIQYALDNGHGRLQLEVALTLGGSYINGNIDDQDFAAGLQIYEKALKQNISDDSPFSAYMHYHLSMLCGSTLLMQCEQETDVSNRRILQLKALQYFQNTLNYDDDLMPMIASFADQMYHQLKTSSDNDKPREIYQYFANQLGSSIGNNWSEHLKQLNHLLNNPALTKEPETLAVLNAHIEAINEHLLDDPSLLPKLSKFVADYALTPDNWKKPVLPVFSAVSKWHLAAATAALEPLFMQLKIDTLPFSEWTQAVKIVTQCNFTPEIQERYLFDLLRAVKMDVIIKGIDSGKFTIADGARFFHTLALLDCNHANPIYLNLAKQLFAALQAKAVEAGHTAVSQLFHAFHYFSAYYPDDKTWAYGADLRKSFEIYRASRCANHGKISKNQEKIHELLKQILPEDQIRQEVFIEVAGRRVDFLLGKNVILQYNGTRFHNMWDDNANRAYDSLKEQLCHKTLTAPNAKQQYYVLRIDRQTWASKHTDKERLSYLKARLATVPIQLREDLESGDCKVPFLGKPSTVSEEDEPSVTVFHN